MENEQYHGYHMKSYSNLEREEAEQIKKEYEDKFKAGVYMNLYIEEDF